MPHVAMYNQLGEKVGEMQLADKLFAVAPNESLVHQVAVGLQANARKIVAHTKTRGEVRGGGKKPWKQKHTGRARHGSIRSPLWIGGGVVFGPRNDRNYEKRIPKTMKRLAFAMALSEKVREHALVIIDRLELSAAKTKEMSGILRGLAAKVSMPGKQHLLVVQKQLDVIRAARNLPTVTAKGADAIGLLDIMKHGTVVTTRAAIERLEILHKA